MQRARNAALRPKLAVDFHRLAPTVVTGAILNVGPGATLDVDMLVVFEPVFKAALHRRGLRATPGGLLRSSRGRSGAFSEARTSLRAVGRLGPNDADDA
jgi:hypothetical protein